MDADARVRFLRHIINPKFQVRYSHYDDLSLLPKVLFVWLLGLKIMFRPWPLFLSVRLATYKNIVKRTLDENFNPISEDGIPGFTIAWRSGHAS